MGLDVEALLDRERELQALTDAIDAAAGGAGAMVCLLGSAGIGKTTLLRRATLLAADRGFAVRSASGGEQEREQPFGVAEQLFGRAVLERTGPASGDTTRALHELLWLAADLADDAPLLLAVDDLHWADRESVGWLRFLARRLDDVPALVLFGVRSGEPLVEAQPLRGLLAEPAIVHLQPRPLGIGALATLAAQALGHAPEPPVMDACLRATGGNPFYMRELLLTLGEHADESAEEIVARIARAESESVGQAVLVRLERLGPAARALATAASILGRDATLARAAQLSGLAPDAAAGAADALIAAEVLAGLRPLDFVHPIVRAAVRGTLSPARRAALHDQAARLLAAEGCGLQEIGSHLLASEPYGDPWVVDQTRAAAGAALARGAPEAAADLLERALREPPPAPARAALLTELGRAERIAGRPGATEHLEAAAASEDPSARAGAIAELSILRTFEGDFAGAAAVVRSELADDAVARLPEVEAALQVQLALLDALVNREPAWPDGLPVPPAVHAARAYWGIWRAHPAAGLAAHAEQALADPGVYALGGDAFPVWYALSPLITGDFQDAAEAGLARALEASIAQGRPGGIGMILRFRAWLRLLQGRLLEAEEDARASVSATRAAGQSDLHPLGLLVDALVQLGRADEAHAELAEAGAHGPIPFDMLKPFLLPPRAAVRAQQGDADGAIDDLLAVRDMLACAELAGPGIPFRLPAVRLLVAAGRGDEAEALAQELLAVGERFATDRTIGWGHHALGLARDDRGELEAAVARFDPAVAPLDRAAALVDLGSAIRRERRLVDARNPLREALNLAQTRSARPLADRALEELRLAGAKPRRAALSGVESLTAAERRIARLAAEGLTNREIAQTLFLTVKTVERHLSSVYSKLDVDSRKALPELLWGSSGASG